MNGPLKWQTSESEDGCLWEEGYLCEEGCLWEGCFWEGCLWEGCLWKGCLWEEGPSLAEEEDLLLWYLSRTSIRASKDSTHIQSAREGLSPVGLLAILCSGLSSPRFFPFSLVLDKLRP